MSKGENNIFTLKYILFLEKQFTLKINGKKCTKIEMLPQK